MFVRRAVIVLESYHALFPPVSLLGIEQCGESFVNWVYRVCVLVVKIRALAYRKASSKSMDNLGKDVGRFYAHLAQSERSELKEVALKNSFFAVAKGPCACVFVDCSYARRRTR